MTVEIQMREAEHMEYQYRLSLLTEAPTQHLTKATTSTHQITSMKATSKICIKTWNLIMITMNISIPAVISISITPNFMKTCR